MIGAVYFLNFTGLCDAETGDCPFEMFTKAGNQKTGIVAGGARKEMAFFQQQDFVIAKKVSDRNAGHPAAYNDLVENHGTSGSERFKL